MSSSGSAEEDTEVFDSHLCACSCATSIYNIQSAVSVSGSVASSELDEIFGEDADHPKKIFFRPSYNHDYYYIDVMWTKLKVASQEILNKNKPKLSFEELYETAYRMVLFKHGDRLYAGLRDVISEHLNDTVRHEILKYNWTDDVDFLSKLNELWYDFQSAMTMISDIFMYMNRIYVRKCKITNIYDHGLIIFKENIVRYPKIRQHLTTILINMIAMERDGVTINRQLLKTTCSMLMKLGINSRSVYEEDFERPFLDQSTAHYRMLSEKYLCEHNVSEYVRKVQARLTYEKLYATLYLDEDTVSRIVRVVINEFFKNHINTILSRTESGIIYMIKNSKFDDLKCVYELFSYVEDDGLQILSNTISMYLREQGKQLVEEVYNENVTNCCYNNNNNINNSNQEETASSTAINPIKYVQNILDLKDHYDYLLHNSFHDDKLFKNMITKDFEYILNLNNNSPKYLSLFIDDKLKKNSKCLQEDELDRILDKTIILFRYLIEKDIFERYYKTHLSKRLLLNKSISDDLENNMISKLKNECGWQFTSKLEGILKDVTITNTIMDEFKNYLSTQHISLDGIEFTIKILTTGFWPTQNVESLNCSVPVEARRSYEIFKKFYLNKHTGRRLTLQPQMGMAYISAKFYGGSYGTNNNNKNEIKLKNVNRVCSIRHHVLQVSTYQMAILMLFNEYAQLAYEEIKNETNIPEKELLRALRSLSMGKTDQRILIRRHKSKDIDATNVFYVNDNFISKFHRVKIQTIASDKDDTEEPERKEIQERVEEGRKQEVEAAIIRILKTRKSLSHFLLIVEVEEQLKLRFRPSSTFIKKQIERLIEREYIGRSPDDNKVYVYLA